MASNTFPSLSFHTRIESKKQSSISLRNAEPGLFGRWPYTGREGGVEGRREGGEDSVDEDAAGCDVGRVVKMLREEGDSGKAIHEHLARKTLRATNVDRERSMAIWMCEW